MAFIFLNAMAAVIGVASNYDDKISSDAVAICVFMLICTAWICRSIEKGGE